jgi:hypothetical protein
MKTFGWSYEKVRTGMTGAECWAWYAWAMENETTAFGSAFKRTTDGYVRQETKRLMAMVDKLK